MRNEDSPVSFIHQTVLLMLLLLLLFSLLNPLPWLFFDCNSYKRVFQLKTPHSTMNVIKIQTDEPFDKRNWSALWDTDSNNNNKTTHNPKVSTDINLLMPTQIILTTTTATATKTKLTTGSLWGQLYVRLFRRLNVYFSWIIKLLNHISWEVYCSEWRH